MSYNSQGHHLASFLSLRHTSLLPTLGLCTRCSLCLEFSSLQVFHDQVPLIFSVSRLPPQRGPLWSPNVPTTISHSLSHYPELFASEHWSPIEMILFICYLCPCLPLSRPRFLNLGTIDTLGWITLCRWVGRGTSCI